MTTLLRGRLVSFDRRPEGPRDLDALTHEEDGGLLIDAGRIRAAGPWAEIAAQAPGAAVHDHRGRLILPGLIDTHLHMPQMQVIASWGTELLDWLNTYTFPAEQRFGDPAHAARIAGLFLDELIRHGTTTAVAYCTVHRASAEALFEAALARDMRLIAGKVLMDRNAPAALTDTAQQGHDDSAALIGAFHGRGRLGYAITPRFAITSTPAQLEAAGALAAAHPDCHVQSHLSE
ncbi:MAG: amidohydrolase family protein, partial [Pseudomonadota bacterium]